MDKISARHYWDNKIDAIYSATCERGLRIGFGTILIQDIIDAAVKCGLVSVTVPDAPGNERQVEAARKQLEGYYLIQLSTGEMGSADHAYDLLIKANTFEEAEARRKSTKSTDPNGKQSYGDPYDYARMFIVGHTAHPSPDVLLRNYPGRTLVWLDREIATAQAAKQREDETLKETERRFAECPHDRLTLYKYDSKASPHRYRCLSCGLIRSPEEFDAEFVRRKNQ